MGDPQTKSKKSMICRNTGKLYVYGVDIQDSEYITERISEITGTAKLMCVETNIAIPPPRTGGKEKKVTEYTYYLEVSESEPLKKYMKESACKTFGFILEQDDNVWQVFCGTKQKDSNIFDLGKLVTRYAFSKPISIDLAIKELSVDILSLVKTQ